MVDEFEESASQIDGEESKSELFKTTDFSNFLTRAYIVDGMDSFIIFTVINNYFFKFRITTTNDPLAKEMILHVIEQVRHILNQYHQHNLAFHVKNQKRPEPLRREVDLDCDFG
jgi:hypothetical protein